MACPSALPAVGGRDADRPLQPRHQLLEHRRLKGAHEAVDRSRLRQGVILGREKGVALGCDLTAGIRKPSQEETLPHGNGSKSSVARKSVATAQLDPIAADLPAWPFHAHGKIV